MDSEVHALKDDGSSTKQLIDAVLQQFEEYDSQKLLRAEGLLYEIYRCILRNGGSNTYQVPHSYITARQNCGEDPIDYIVSREDYLAGETVCYALINGAYPTYTLELDNDEDEEI
jgi:hypothetical protein